MVRIGGSAVLVALALAFCEAHAHAAPPSSHPTKPSDRALDLFEQSARAYREGRFQDAVDKLLEARRLKSEPVLLYNLARAYEALGRWEEAADAYTQYLAEEPNTSDRKAIEARIPTLRAQAAELAAARRAPTSTEPEPKAERPPEAPTAPPPTPPPPDTHPRATGPGIAPWLVVGAGVAAVGVGFALGVAANNAHDDAVAERVQQKAVDRQKSGEKLADGATTLIITGAIIAAGGIAWALIARNNTTASAGRSAVSVSVASPTLGWTF